jgi:tetratricopeptide (TPR) repeat protein
MPYLSRILTVALIMSVVGGGWADPLTLLQKNRYFKAIDAWDKDAVRKTVSQNKLRALKGQAIAYYKLGMLYKKLHEFSFALAEEYYKAIAKHTKTPTLYLYQGQIHYYYGRFNKASKLFERVIINRKATQKEKDLAKIYRHYSLNRIRGKNLRLLLKSKDPAVNWQMLTMKNTTEIPGDLQAKDIRSMKNKLDLLLRQEKIDEKEVKKYLNKILQAADAEIILNKGKLTQINFYDPMVLYTLSRAFFQMSKLRYKKLAKYSGRYPTLSSKFRTAYNLAEVNYELGLLREAEKQVKSDRTKNGYLLRARIKAKRNQPDEAKELLNALTAKDNSPSAKREAGYAFYELGLSNKKALFLSNSALQKKKTSLYYRRYAAILYGSGKYDEALEAYAKGYKIQFKNNVDYLDPAYMIEYAFAIFKTSKMRYEEVVETLYHIQKAYPVCRQLHYCMQGIAAADAQAISGEKIFRKGN